MKPLLTLCFRQTGREFAVTVHAKDQLLPSMVRVELWGFRCKRCGHEWLPRVPDKEPKVCAKCKSPDWDRPRPEPKAG